MTQNRFVYLDHNATTPLRPNAKQRMLEIYETPSNASSVHRFGRAARAVIEQSRTKIAEACSVFPREVIFTGSGTEADNWVARYTGAQRVLIGATEHSAMLLAPENPEHIPVLANGTLDLAALDEMLARGNEGEALVSAMFANNETGVLHPLTEIADICRRHGALLHVDAINSFGKVALDAGTIGADYISISAHKCGGPVGAAALIARDKMPLQPMNRGGQQEYGRRGGTENVAAIAGFAVAAEESAAELTHMAQVERWIRGMEQRLLEAAPGAIIHGKDATRSPNTCCISMPGVGGEIQLMDFDLNGFAVSSGSACTSGKTAGSHVLAAMGISPDISTCAIRVSAGWNTTEEEIDRFTDAWIKLYQRNSSQPAHMAIAGL